MNHTDHMALLRPGILRSGGVWADLGAGDGAFTLALAELIGPGSRIIAIDQDARALDRLTQALTKRYPEVMLQTQAADFTQPLTLPPLDGIVMANSLHFVRHKQPLLARLRTTLKENGRLLIVEYNSDWGNRWVPFPFSYATWTRLAQQAGFTQTVRLGSRPSRFLDEIYSAASWS